jgi:TonB family protein
MGSCAIISKIPVTDNDPIVQELVAGIKTLRAKSPVDSVVIQLASNKPFQYLFTIMNTLGFLDIRNILLSVKNIKANQAYVYLKIPTPNPSKTGVECDAGTEPTIIFADTVITIGYKFGFLPSLFTNTKDSVHVFDELSTRLKKMKKKYSNSIDLKSVILAFDDAYPYSKVIKTLDFAYSFGFTNIQISKLKTAQDSTSNQHICTLYDRSRASITDTVNTHLKELKSLYFENFKTNPPPSGQVVVKFKIERSGKVTSAQVKESSIHDKSFEEKVLDKVRKWNFGEIDKPGDITEVVYPFVFSK